MSIREEYEAILAGTTVAGPAAKDAIATAEQQLAIQFPPSYSLFLRRFGAAMGSGFEVFGLFVSRSCGPPLWRDVISECRQFRETVRDAIPNSLIPISDDGCGVNFLLESKEGDTSGIVIAYGPGIDGEVVATEFEEFVVKIAQGQIG